MEVDALRYWCYECSRRVNLMEINTIECPICQSGFVEEMPSADSPRNVSPLDFELGEPGSDLALALSAPMLLGMLSNQRRRRQFRHVEFEEDENENGNENNTDRDTELDHELGSIMRRRRRSAAAIIELLRGLRAGIISESGHSETEQQNSDTESESESDREPVVLVNPFNRTLVIQGSYDPSDNSQNHGPVGSLGDYFIGQSLDLLLQHLSENDPNRYGTPPARKEAVEALPTVKVKDTVQCSVCLDDCEIGTEVKEMPCKHIFHENCILPWLALHSSCPICRRQLPSDEAKLDLEGLRNNNNGNNESSNADINGGDVSDNNGRQFSVSLPWPISSLFSSSSSRSSGGNSATTDAAPSTSHDDAN